MCSSGLSWVCNFLQHNSNFTSEIVPNGISKEKEGDLLMMLSTVCRHFHKIGNDNSQQESGTNGQIDNVENSAFCGYGKDIADHSCIELVTETLVFLLVFESDFISHLAGKTLYVLSCYLMELDSEWKLFLHHLWISLKSVCFKLEIQSMCDSANRSYPYAMDQRSSTSGAIDIKQPYYIAYLTKEIQCSDASNDLTCLKIICTTASQLMQLLRNILKTCYLKTEKLVDNYLHITEAYIMDIAWILLNNICLDDTVSPVKGSCKHSLVSLKNRGYHYVEKELVLGSLLQILCSLVHAIAAKHSEVEGGNLISKWPLLTKVNEMIPALSIQCLALQNHAGQNCISDFLRHKLLILMIRLSDCILHKPSFFMLWLDLLLEHAADLLCHPLPEKKIHESTLLGSPFWTSSDHCNREFNICKNHLHSRAVFLLFKCYFVMIREDIETPKKASSFHGNSLETKSEISVTQLNSVGKSGNEKAVAALTNWLQRQMSYLSPLTGDVFRSRWTTFTSSFLQLFMDEDDLMFQMLLQLLDMPLLLQQEKCDGNSVLDSKRHMDACLPILESLRPDFLFHEFLAGIQYDHSVIVDYLISKSTGTLCLRYLLRCLRVLCDSWPNSIEFSIDVGDPTISSCKRGRHQLDLKVPLEQQPSIVSEMSGILTAASGTPQIIEPSKDRLKLRQKAYKRKRGLELFPMSRIAIDKSRIESAVRCLSSFYVHIESLHKKDLFPYNPSPLLKRLVVNNLKTVSSLLSCNCLCS